MSETNNEELDLTSFNPALRMNHTDRIWAQDEVEVHNTYLTFPDLPIMAFGKDYLHISGTKRTIYVSIEYSERHQALRFTPVPNRASTSSTYTLSHKGTHSTNSRFISGSIPTAFKRMHVPRGIYKQHTKYPNIYIWQRPSNKKEK